MKASAFLFSILFFVTGCNPKLPVKSQLDYAFFELTGSTVFSDPNQITIKQIHLDNGQLLGKEIIVEGHIVNVGKQNTYLVIADKTARLLIVLTNIINADMILGKHSPKALRILGTVERGKRGLPFISAGAFKALAKLDQT